MNPVRLPNPKDERPTDETVFAELNAMFGPFDIDVAATVENTKCKQFYTFKDNALKQEWNGSCWCNPPYSMSEEFVAKAIEETKSGRAKQIVMLMPASTSAIWFREAYEHCDELHAASGRLKFGDATEPAKFANVVFVFRAKAPSCSSGTSDFAFKMPTRHGGRETWYPLKGSSTISGHKRIKLEADQGNRTFTPVSGSTSTGEKVEA